MKRQFLPIIILSIILISLLLNGCSQGDEFAGEAFQKLDVAQKQEVRQCIKYECSDRTATREEHNACVQECMLRPDAPKQVIVDVTEPNATAPQEENESLQETLQEPLQENVSTEESPSEKSFPGCTDKDLNDMSILIPAGDFLMGDSGGPIDEITEHVVTLDAYRIDKYEVTVYRYQQCVGDGICDDLYYPNETHSDYFDNPKYCAYPVVFVDWTDANRFCEWDGGRVCTEAEWERAAAGPLGSERKYPWGNDEPSCDNSNSLGCVGFNVKVGSHPAGATPEGVNDLAGNVWEWVSDSYSSDYYLTETDWSNPQGPSEDSDEKSIRGGSWYLNYAGFRTSDRDHSSFNMSDDNVGIRCCRDASDEMVTEIPDEETSVESSEGDAVLPSELNAENVDVMHFVHYARYIFPQARTIRVDMLRDHIESPFNASRVDVDLYDSNNDLLCSASSSYDSYMTVFSAMGEPIPGYTLEDDLSFDYTCNLELAQIGFGETFQVRIDDPRFKPIIKTFQTGDPDETYTAVTLNVEER